MRGVGERSRVSEELLRAPLRNQHRTAETRRPPRVDRRYERRGSREPHLECGRQDKPRVRRGSHQGSHRLRPRRLGPILDVGHVGGG